MDNQQFQPVQNQSIWTVILPTIIITVLIVGGGVWWWQKSSFEKEKEDLQQQIEELKKSGTYYKKFQSDSITFFEVPKTWSILSVRERVGTNELLGLPAISVGQEEVSFGDINWNQIDFYYVANDIVDSLIQKAASYGSELSWNVETIGGIETAVVTYPLEHGKATKGGTGGKDYFVRLPGDSIKTLVISKQALGNEEFENEFEHLIESISFSNF